MGTNEESDMSTGQRAYTAFEKTEGRNGRDWYDILETERGAWEQAAGWSNKGQRAYIAYEKTQGRNGDDWFEIGVGERKLWMRAAQSRTRSDLQREADAESEERTRGGYQLTRQEWEEEWEVYQLDADDLRDYTALRKESENRWKTILKWVGVLTTVTATAWYDVVVEINLQAWGVSLRGVEEEESRRTVQVMVILVWLITVVKIWEDLAHHQIWTAARCAWTRRRNSYMSRWYIVDLAKVVGKLGATAAVLVWAFWTVVRTIMS